MVRIFLTGYMGAGKTTLGKAFARELGLSFVDLDWYIEERFHQTISQLFAERGEDGFRRLERNMLHEVGDFENVVVSTGGGTPCFFDNMDYMNAQGQTVFLDVDEETLFRRLRVATAQRPILRGKSETELRVFIREALAKRMPYYAQARYRFDGSRLESRAQISESVERLREVLGLKKG
ncbi:MAG TPA: shikimate kinase [Candidatus Bacteroides merdipullorum]|uniref:Shikimate kinase n=1 Tax=Candidatus Bacteroides merdipullorum TaxID=2838474 RepID=A0A9D2CWC5_9BACE|nr:shikimate kinase [Candidatus Bacteroides merdipullorum]